MTTSGRSRIVDRILKQESVRAGTPDAPLTESAQPEETPAVVREEGQVLAGELPSAAAGSSGDEGVQEAPAAPTEVSPPQAPEPTPAPAQPAEEPAEGDEEAEEDLGKLLDSMQVRHGQIVSGTVAQIDADGIRVDIGTKAEGLIPVSELGSDFATEFKVGDAIDVYVLKVETDDGYPLLSKSRADFHQLWNELEDDLRTGKILTVLVKDRVKGGLIVDVGVDGFVPASHTTADAQKRPGSLDKFVGRTLRVRVLECDRKRNRVVLSHRQIVEEERRRREEETLGKIEVGAAMTGVVRRLTDFGAFVDLGGIDGLLHISEMSWTRIQHPSEVVNKGDKIQVIVLKWDPETKRISLGMRQLLADPWKGAAKKYPIGATVKVQITRLIGNGAFARLDSGLEGIIPISELAHGRVNRPEDVVSVGDEVEARVLQVRENQRRITLSLREAQQAQEQREYRDYMKTQNSGAVTLGDVFGKLLNGRKPAEEGEAASAPAEPESSPPPAAPAEAAPVETEAEEAPTVEPQEAPAEPAAEQHAEPVADELATDDTADNTDDSNRSVESG